ncbi:MAG: hypothetical protein CVV33_01450 [Methanomicrobiales archaeon HGW-Methanomicrobiales-4]|nr:MAG: hypothetical protein CVV33_01450 [Methanomicrobiales archaeon HGW-Methanomicrobiales-4]
MKHRNWLYLFAAGLIFLSLLIFTLHYLLFHDLHHILIYTIHDLAFLPIEVLLVTVVIHSLLERQVLQQKLDKLNMVIGTFYSGIGNELLREFVRFDPNISTIREELLVLGSWDAKSFKLHKKKAKGFLYTVSIHEMDLNSLREMLLRHEDFLLRILENPVMLEHESFTDVLRSVFHLAEELKHRSVLQNLPDSDLAHLKEDIRRAYSHMTISWLDYMQYLQVEYPYLFSLAIRIDPFDEKIDVHIRE